MMNNLPGPDKGLLDVLFGANQPEAAQATIPEGAETIEAALKGKDLPEAFKKILMVAQDQKAAEPEITAQPKDGSKKIQAQAEKAGDDALSATTLKTQSIPQPEMSRKPVAKPLANVAPVPAEVVAGTSRKPKAEPKAETVDPMQATGTPAALAAAAVSAAQTQVQAQTQAPMQVQAQAQVQAPAQKPVQAAAGATGPKSLEATAKQPKAETKAAPQPKAEVAAFVPAVQTPAVTSAAAQAGVKSTGRTNQQSTPVSALTASASTQAQAQASAPATMVVQPIVIQMPLAVPVDFDVIDVDMPQMTNGRDTTTSTASQARSGKSLLSSQDFIAGRALSNEMSRLDPELALMRKPGKAAELRDSGSELSLVLPQVVRERADAGVMPAGASISPMPPRTSVDISNPMALAAQVNGLAANGGGTIRVRVMPENLGELTIAVNSRGRKLDVQFEASSNEARDALMSALPELKQALSAARYDVGTVDVSASMSHAMSWMSPAGDASGSSQWSNQSYYSSSEFGGNNSGNSNRDASTGGHGGASQGWDRYFAQQDGQSSGGRQQSGYRRYQQAELM